MQQLLSVLRGHDTGAETYCTPGSRLEAQHPKIAPVRWYHPHFAEGEMRLLEGLVIFPHSHSQKRLGVDFWLQIPQCFLALNLGGSYGLSASGISEQPGPPGRIGPKGEPGECVGAEVSSSFFALSLDQGGRALLGSCSGLDCQGASRLGGVGRIRRRAWAPSPLVVHGHSLAGTQTSEPTLFLLKQEIQHICSGARRAGPLSQGPGTWTQTVLGCWWTTRCGTSHPRTPL